MLALRGGYGRSPPGFRNGLGGVGWGQGNAPCGKQNSRLWAGLPDFFHNFVNRDLIM
jgi:hypothetical protein